MTIKKVTVLGAGNMGSQIAALFVNAGLKVKLLDIVIDKEDPNKLSREALERITHPKKGLLYSSKFASNISYGNFDEDLVGENDSDLFIEAVSEILEVKHDLFTKVSKIAKEGAILTTNTSGIPIKEIASVLPKEQAERFLGLHFFNPPRFMKLVEIIPHENTDEKVVELLSNFTSRTLGKGVITTNDVSGFVANRIGVYALMDVMDRAEKQGLSVTEVDALTGPVIGRPKTATYRLMDLVGVDIAYNVAKGMKEDPAEEEYYVIAKSATDLVEKGFLGNKVKQGYYKKEGKAILSYDYTTGEYTDSTAVNLEFLSKLGRNLKENLRVIFDEREDNVAKFVWESLANVIYYSAINVGKATNDFKNIDRAMVWGYNWKLGPFQIWDAIGFEDVKARLKEEFGSLPTWIEERNESFYGDGEGISSVKGLQEYVKSVVWSNPNVSDLYETEDDTLIYVMRSPNNTFTNEFAKDTIKAVDFLNNSKFKSMVLYSEGPNFSLGANLGDVSTLIKEGKLNEISDLIDVVHDAVYTLKYSDKPIVTASKGRALGGGAELLLSSPFVVAAAESYIGLVEIGVGLIPSGGGLSELAERIYKQRYERAEELAALNRAFETVIFGKVSGNAYEARELGLLKETDIIIQNEELVLEAALKKARLEAEYNYIPKGKLEYATEGNNYLAVAKAKVASLVSGGFATEYEEVIAKEVATVLSGGDIPYGVTLTQEDLLALEKKGFLKLCANPKTLERIEHMLATKRVLRN
ncbi:MAG: 3-hydroxyacyl-CoA dehydrogenase/enoyl-CoA hydratase family protein [Gemella sp.]|nr:3-hydroxyacyl-CoA dehydrogenase/enoyl-CoA hydratase family protein [Gemella sp.]